MLEIPITFQFDIDSETERVKQTFNNKKWLVQNKYRFSLPATIENLENVSETTIRQSIKAEYKPEVYNIAKEAILKSWTKNCQTMKKINDKMSSAHKLEKLNVTLTRYGTQGSYQLPNTVIINIIKVPPEFLIKTVIHESFHLMIEHLIKEYKVEHWVKERIVDLIMDLEYQSRFKMQPTPNWTQTIDESFKQYYPNLVLITKAASKISPTN